MSSDLVGNMIYHLLQPLRCLRRRYLEKRNAEIYYMLEGAATLVTGGTLVNSTPAPNNRPSVRGYAIEGGVSRRVVPGDVIIIPGHTPHWWSSLEGDISYLIFRPDPDNRIPLR